MEIEIRFLIQCYFGDIEDPYLASIDKAYFDMQTHTINGKKGDIYRMRFLETEYLYERVKNLPTEKDFDVWHRNTSDVMRNMDTPIVLTYGQIQKWINMTIKYLYTLRSLGVESVDDYFVNHKNDFHAPIDSFVLSGRGIKGVVWSTIDTYEEYLKIRNQIPFDDEYERWPEYALLSQKKNDGMDKSADKGSYKRYIQDNYSNKGRTYCGKRRWQSKEVVFMKVKIKGIDGMYAVGECGVVDIGAYEDQETAVENRNYGKFEKKKLYWTVYDQIILPIRNTAGTDPDHSIRLLFIEDDGDKMILHYNIDDYDESYCEIQGVANKTLDEVMDLVYEDICGMVNALPDGEPLKEAITWDKSKGVNIPDDYLERLKKDVFYTSWVIEY